MELQINKNSPLVMHIDLNSCFATCIQQAFPHLRGKPIAIAAYTTPNGCILAPSIEAKRYGIKTGMTVREGKLLFPNLIVRPSDPVLVRDVHIKFRNICRDYSPNVAPKSIDELIIDFHGMEHLNIDLVTIAKEIKLRFRQEIGDWISCNVGISTNRFLAKLAASLHKPDGLDIVDHGNLLDIYSKVTLIDLNGINKRYEARLNANGIFTPLEFLHSSEITLRKQVFQSIVGKYWYFRLRGFEMDDVEFTRKSYGQDYALKKHTNDPKEVARIVMKLVEKMGRRVRGVQKAAHGFHVGMIYNDGTYWHKGKTFHTEAYTTQEFFKRALYILNLQPAKKPISKITISCYGLVDSNASQDELFEYANKDRKVSEAVDMINDRYGEYVVTPAIMMGMNSEVLDRISFGAIKELEDLYA
jgi:DNA polymerase-4